MNRTGNCGTIRKFPDRKNREFSAHNREARSFYSDQLLARQELLQTLREQAPRRYGFNIVAPDYLRDDPSGDHLDALLCAVQAAWAWRRHDAGFGAPETVDHLEGWIADSHLT